MLNKVIIILLVDPLFTRALRGWESLWALHLVVTIQFVIVYHFVILRFFIHHFIRIVNALIQAFSSTRYRTNIRYLVLLAQTLLIDLST